MQSTLPKISSQISIKNNRNECNGRVRAAAAAAFEHANCVYTMNDVVIKFIA